MVKMNETAWARFKRSLTVPSFKTIKVHLVLLSVQLVFAVFYILGKIALRSMDPFVFLTYRLLLATPLLWVFGFIIDRQQMKQLPTNKKHWLLLILVGVLAVSINQSLFLEGLELSTASNAAITQPAIPIFSTLFAVMMGLERKTKLKFIGIGVSVVGAILMVDFTQLTHSSASSKNLLLGNICFLGNTLAYSGFLLLQRPLQESGYSPVKIMSWGFLFGSIPVFGLSMGVVKNLSEFASVSVTNWLVIIYTAVLATAYTFWASSWAVQNSDATTVAVYLCVEPLATAIMAALVLHERLTPLNIVGAFVVLFGVGMVMVSKHRERQKDILEEYAKKKLLVGPTPETTDDNNLEDNIKINTVPMDLLDSRKQQQQPQPLNINDHNADDLDDEDTGNNGTLLAKVVMNNQIYRIVESDANGEVQYIKDVNSENREEILKASSSGNLEEIFDHDDHNKGSRSNSYIPISSTDKNDDIRDLSTSIDINENENQEHLQLKRGNRIFH